MVAIPGTIGKTAVLFDFFADLESKSNANNKRKLGNNLSQLVQFPISTSHIDPPLLEYLWGLDKIEQQNIRIEWKYERGSEAIYASMKAISSVGCIVENEQALMLNKFREDTISRFEDSSQLFTTLVFACFHNLISVNYVKLTKSLDPSHGLILMVEFTVDYIKVKKSKYYMLVSTLAKSIPLKDTSVNVSTAKKIKSVHIAQNTAPESSSASNKYIASTIPSHHSFSTNNISSSSKASPRSSSVNNRKPSSSTISTSSSSSSCDDTYFIVEGVRIKIPPKIECWPLISSLLPTTPNDVSLDAFFNNLQPCISEEYLEHCVSPTIITSLMPYQTQNIDWMIKREGHMVHPSGEITVLNNKPCPLLHAYDTQKDNYIQLFSGKPVPKDSIEELKNISLKGGILADEMGLGKTVSVLGLVTKHTWNHKDPDHPKPELFPNYTFSKGTLIIAPGSIITQWHSEVQKHAPSLQVYEYKGALDDPISIEELATYDIVLVHYETFKSEISHSKKPPPRSRRHAVKYDFRLSPLVSILWFRCILDEAQMVESITTKTSAMAKLIPRWYSWGVTGTPMKTKYTDLYGLYNFLSLDTCVSDDLYKFRLLFFQKEYKGLFFHYTQSTIRRNMKSVLHGQVFIPKQTRNVVYVPFSTIEQHYYEDLWKKCKSNLQLDWLDRIGWSLPANASEFQKSEFNRSKLKMRSFLLALRQNCIHPSVIVNTGLRLGVQSTSANANRVQSLSQVLEDMSRDATQTYNQNLHNFYCMLLRFGGMHEVLKDWQNAMNIYIDNIPKVEELVEIYLKDYQTMQLNYKKEGEEEKKIRLTAAATNCSRWQILLHQFYFYTAGVSHIMRLDEQEHFYYQKAGNIRQILLEKHLIKVENSLLELKKSETHVIDRKICHMGSKTFDEDILKYKEYYVDRDQEYGEVSEKDQDINMIKNLKSLGGILDKQYDKMMFLREKLVEILTKSLIDNESEDNTGDEYENSLQEQAICQVYISSYQAHLQDRKFIIKGTLVSNLEGDASDSNNIIDENASNVKRIEDNFRKSLMYPGFELQCLKDLQFFLRNLKGSMRKNESSKEAIVLSESYEWIQSSIGSQYKLIDSMETDLKKLTQLFNHRIIYYKSLQNISDTILEWKHNQPKREIQNMNTEITKLQARIASSRSRSSYFKDLIEEQNSSENGQEKEPKDCLICQEQVERGMITYCGHTSCLECGLLWFGKNRRCHTCNASVQPNEWYKVSYREVEMHETQENQTPSSSKNPRITDTGASNDISEVDGNQGQLRELLQKISKESVVPGQGAKIDSIVRHIKYIKNYDNGKCVVFSQWSKVLDMIRSSLNKNGIKYVMLTGGVNKASIAKFQHDPTVNVILLHAKSQSSGLTLVAAQTVFIVEPVFNESVERQAISRVHRIGQTKQTSVFWYIVQDTIEERIQLIHNRKRNRRVVEGINETDDVFSLASQTDGGGEYVNDNDLRSCFTSNSNFI